MAEYNFDGLSMEELDGAHKDWHERKLESETALREEGRAIRAAKAVVRERERVAAMSDSERQALLRMADVAASLSDTQGGQ